MFASVAPTPDPYTTQLSPEEEAAFQQWKAQYAPHDSGEDYDLRGFWKSGGKIEPGKHGPDTYKKPNHPTFSNQSIYSTPDRPGGEWTKEGFVPTETNLRYHPLPQLEEYFKRVEPNVKLLPTRKTTP